MPVALHLPGSAKAMLEVRVQEKGQSLPLKRGKPSWAWLSRPLVCNTTSAIPIVMGIFVSVVLYKSKLPQSPSHLPSPHTHTSLNLSRGSQGTTQQSSERFFYPTTQCLSGHFKQYGHSRSLDP